MASNFRDFLCLTIIFITESLLVKAMSNVALGKSAYQSSTLQNIDRIHHASLSVDGNTDGSKSYTCSFTLSSENNFWEVDLGAIYNIDHVTVYNRLHSCCSGRTRNVQVLVGFDQNDYEQFGYLEGLLGSHHTFQMDTPTYGRWVRITRNGVSDYLNICEVEVYGELLTTDKIVRFKQLSNKIGVGAVLGVIQQRSEAFCAAHCKTLLNCAGFNFDLSNLQCMMLRSASTNDNFQEGLSFYRLA